jgi:glycosyltransferase involved in cell wall biosynthesis
MTSPTLVRILTTSRGNDFMVDVARMLAHGLSEEGIPHEVLIDQVPSPQDGDALHLVVAPHEFFPLFLEREVDRSRLDDLNRESAVLNVEQPGSQWFELSYHYARHSRGVFDISRQGVSEFRRRGIWARHLPLRYAPFLGGPDPDTPSRRPVDVLFMGYASPRRELFFARHAEAFSRMDCRIILADLSRPRSASTPGYYAGARRADLLASTKIVLNVHATDSPYFETHRALLAFSNRCLLITETSRQTDDLVAGRHFVMASLDELPDRCRYYLDHSELLDTVATDGHTFVRTDLGRAAYGSALAAIEPTVDQNAQIANDHSGRSEVLARLRTSHRSRQNDGAKDWSEWRSPAYETAGSPSVTVLVTLFNYANYIDECLASAMASEPVPGGFELVVVDDGSTDDSESRVQSFLNGSDAPGLLIRKSVNTGLADARNVGLMRSRGGYVFVLDADNRLYPPCLRVLLAAIQGSGRSAVYSLIQRFDDLTAEPLGLLSVFDWSEEALVRGPYIDAMSLVDRRAIESVGGYSTELIEHGWFGWEDYDLWLKLCQANRTGMLVPRILSSYRVHANSMLRRTNRSSNAIARHFVEKFHDLIARFPNEDRYFGFPAAELNLGAPAKSADLADLSAIRQRCHDLEGELRAVYLSKSWRVTAPLRSVLNLLRGIAPASPRTRLGRDE